MTARTVLVIAVMIAWCSAPGSIWASWLDAIPLTASGTDSETGLNHTPLVYDGVGGLHVAWAERDTPGLNYQIYWRHRAWATWSDPELVVPYPDPFPGALLGAKFPSLAASADSVWMVWHDYRHGGIANAEIYLRVLALPGEWRDELRITTTSNTDNPGDNGLVPTIAAIDDDLHVAWYDFRWHPEEADIFHARRLQGVWTTALGDSSDINVSAGVNAGWNAGAPAIAAGAGGVVHALWADHRSGVDRIRYARFGTDLTWTEVETVAEPGAPVDAPTAAVTVDGTLHIVWVESAAGGARLMTRERTTDGAWTAPLVLTSPEFLAGDPCLVADAAGDLHLVWQDARLGLLNREIFYRRRNASGSWDTSGQSDLNLSLADGRSERPSIVADPSGNLAVLWRDRRSGAFELWLREFRPAGPIAVVDPAPENATPRPLVCGPNPFSAALAFAELPGEPVAVIGIDGRRLLTLAPTARGWDGRLADGRPAPRGVYFLVGQSTGGRARVVYLR